MRPSAFVRAAVVGCLLGSGLTQLWETAEQLLPGSERPQHLEIPGDEPGRVLAILEACRALVLGDEALAVVGSGDVVNLFLHYRLAYELYPVRVDSETYAPGEEQRAVARAAARQPRFVLVLGAAAVSLPDGRVVARPTPVDVLLRSEAMPEAVASR